MKKKLIRVTTADISLNGLLKGQLRFLNQYYDVVGVAADSGEMSVVAAREGIRTIAVPMHREISLAADMKCLWALYRLFRKEAPYIVHANTPKGSLLAMVAAWMARVPNRLYMVTGLRYQGARGVFRFVLKSMERTACLFATKVIPEGQGVIHTLQHDHITHKPLRVIWNGNINGIDTSYFSREALKIDREHMREGLGVQPDEFAFIFIGRMVKDKGLVELAHAMQQLSSVGKKVKLILVGNFEQSLDPLPQDIYDFLRGDARICYVGYQQDVRPYLLVADALVFPSYREGFPNVPLQAGAMDLPSIVTNINGCNEIIKDGLNGTIIMAALNDNGVCAHGADMERALFLAMKRYVEHPEEVKRMAKNARQMIKERYEQKDVWNALLKMYHDL